MTNTTMTDPSLTVGSVTGGKANAYAAAAQTVGSAMQSIVNVMNEKGSRVWQENMAKMQNQFNREEAEKQRDWQQQMWNLENQYNTPAAQMNRMLEAGINPNSAVQTLTNAAANVGSGSAASAASVPNPVTFDLGAPFGAITPSVANSILQIKQAQKLDKEIPWIDTEKKTSVDQVKTAVDKIKSEIKLNEQQFNYLEQANPLFVGKTKEEINQIVKSTQLAAQQIEESKQRVKESQSQQGLIEAETHKTNVEITGVNYDNVVKKLKADLAQSGIIVDSNPLMSLLSVAMSGNGDEVLSALSKAIEDMLPSIPDAVSNIVGGANKGLSKLQQLMMMFPLMFNQMFR